MAGDDRPAVRLRGLGRARGVATADLVAPFTASLETGLAELDAIVAETAAETGLAPAILRDYFTRNLRYRMGPAEQAGLAEFLRRAEAHGFTSRPSTFSFAGD